MNSHELATKLLQLPAVDIRASVDLSMDDHDAGNRAFGELYGLQLESDGTVMLLFECGRLNFQRNGP